MPWRLRVVGQRNLIAITPRNTIPYFHANLLEDSRFVWTGHQGEWLAKHAPSPVPRCEARRGRIQRYRDHTRHKPHS